MILLAMSYSRMYDLRRHLALNKQILKEARYRCGEKLLVSYAAMLDDHDYSTPNDHCSVLEGLNYNY